MVVQALHIEIHIYNEGTMIIRKADIIEVTPYADQCKVRTSHGNYQLNERYELFKSRLLGEE